MSDSSFFTKLGDNNAQETLEFLVHNQTALVLKIHDKHFKTKMLSKKNETEFSIYKFDFSEYQNEEITCSFEIKDEKYFFKSFIKAHGADLILAKPQDVYQLQRRNDFRVSIPASVNYTCEIRTINYQKANIKVELRDLSLGGCLVILKKVDQIEIPKDSEVEISLKINDFESMSILTIAKHVRPVESSGTIQLGLQYTDPSTDFLSELQTLLIQLDRILRGKNKE